jgi:two-component system, NtrC family, sensor kinase
MPDRPTLRRELLGAFAVVFAGALFVALVGILYVVPQLDTAAAAGYVLTLLVADVVVFSWFGALLLRRRLLRPLDELVAGVEAISAGELDRRLPQSATRELDRLGTAVNQMAERLLSDRQQLTDNIRSLDETNRLLTEARNAMIRAEKMASVGRLGAGIAHEVGNPLGAIIGYLNLIGRHADGQRLEFVQAAEREAQRIDRIIRGLLDFARPREAMSQPIDVNVVVRDTLDLLRTQRRFAQLEIETVLNEETRPIITGDPFQLQQVMVNLLVNAVDALEDVREPRVTIMTVRRRTKSAEPHVPARRKEDPPGIDYSHRRRLPVVPRWPAGDPESESGDVVEIVVHDNGPGLDGDLVDQVFEPFMTTKEPGKGTGLGLALCARLIEGMGGAIHAGNADDGGAAFRIILPAAAAEVVPT